MLHRKQYRLFKTGGLADVVGSLPKMFSKRIFRCKSCYSKIRLYETGILKIGFIT